MNFVEKKTKIFFSIIREVFVTIDIVYDAELRNVFRMH